MTSDSIHAGGQSYERWVDLEVVDVQRQLAEIDPNLVLVKAPTPEFPRRWGVMWNGPDAKWHAYCFHNDPTRTTLQALPTQIRQRDNASPTNSRESAFERDVRRTEENYNARQEDHIERLVEASQRVYHGFGKDTGQGRKTVSLRPSSTQSG